MTQAAHHRSGVMRVYAHADLTFVAWIEPTGRANARPMTGSAKSGTLRWWITPPDFAKLNPGYSS